MATDDRQVLVTGTAPTPADFTVPGNGQIRPKSVFAHFDGSAAASPFLPVLKILSDGGEVVALCPTTTTTAAGGSVDVSWFPYVTPKLQAFAGARIQATAAQNVTNATNTDLHYQQVYFDTDGMADLATDDRVLTVNTGGIYLVTVATAWDYHANAEGRRINVVLQNGFYSVGGVPDQFSVVDERMPIWATSGIVPPAPRTTNLVQGIFDATPGDFFSSGVYQASGGVVSANGYPFCFLSAVLIGTV